MSATIKPQKPPHTIPPRLENGDHLTRPEFERRYAAMPTVLKAELINGVVYTASPTRHGHHGQQHSRLIWFLSTYMIASPGTDTGDNSSLRLDLDNEPQPDGLLRLVEAVGGRSSVDDEGYLTGSPELICEIAASSVSYDLGPKLDTYRRHGVQEYLVWRVQDNAVDWFTLREGHYDPLTADTSGILKSQVFPGLWLAVPALLGDDMAAVQQTLQHGLESSEHHEFLGTCRQVGLPAKGGSRSLPEQEQKENRGKELNPTGQQSRNPLNHKDTKITFDSSRKMQNFTAKHAKHAKK